ncbi:WG repeat-containing protein [Empedobacter falsenii]|uniref:WG repeat-containing protein n=1 Tax=Empedobacter falsenii TaxID=343874 RepID=UPI0025760DEA|nr:WG repeat-containing protein [Empedobacter falsenii]MDM1298449.1 WG repeat-containing protein [Empedobacter falsenii]MDM1317994.1 WG repeat-containing protein [Empedobacter falsenii]
MKIIILVLLMVCSFTSFGQNKEVKERIEDLQDAIDGITQMDKMYDIQLVIKPSDTTFDENDSFAFTNSVKPEGYLNVATKLENKEFQQTIIAPYSILEIEDTDGFDWSKMLGVDNFFFDKHPNYKPVLTLSKVYFEDGTSKKAEEVLVANAAELLDKDNNSFNDSYFLIKSTKMVVSIEYYFAMQAVEYTTLNFTPQKTAYVVNNQNIVLKSWSGKEVGFLFTEETLDKLLGIDAVYKNGKFLSEKGSNSSSLPSISKRKQFQELSKFYSETIKSAQKNNFKTVKDLDDYLLKNQPKIDTVTPNDVLKNYYFSGPPTEIRMYFAKENSFITNQLIKNDRAKGYAKQQNRVIAYDFATKLQGVTNAKGEWLVKPEFRIINNLNDYFFSVRKDENDEGAYFWLSDDGKKWQKLNNINLYRQTVYGDFVTVEKGINGPKGLFNIKTGELVIPTVNDNIYVEDDLFIVKNNDNTIILDINGKTIIEGNYKSVKIDNPFIYLLSKNGNNFSGYQVYNYQGKNISTNFLSDGGYESGDDLVLVYKKGNGEYDRDYSYLNTNGDVVITVDPNKYEKAERFRNKRALWKEKDGYYGFVNEKGKTVIPFDLIDASEFRGKYAIVKRKINNDKVWVGLIDENGKNHKEFIGWPYYMGYDEENKSYFYNIDDKTVYDGEGNIIKKE